MQDFSLPQAQPFFFPEGEHAVLLIHGFTGSPAHMRLVGEGLRDRGFAVKGILLPGHGETPEAMGRATWQDWVLAAREAAKELRQNYKYLTVAGLSMGGCLALMLAEQMEADACVTIAAPMKTTVPFRSLALLAAPFYPTLHKRDDEARATLDPDYDIDYESYPMKSVHHLSVIMSRARKDLALIHCPILAIQSHGDRTVTADSPQIILDGVSSTVKAQLWLDTAPHVCTISPEYGKIVEGMAAFLGRAENIRGDEEEYRVQSTECREQIE